MDTTAILMDFCNKDMVKPFDVLPRKINYTSKHNTLSTARASQSTLSPTLIKMLMLSVDISTSTDYCGGVGSFENPVTKHIVEIPNATKVGSYDIVIYDYITGAIMAGIYNNDKTITQFELKKGQKDATLILLAMLPILLQDDEFEEYYTKFKEYYLSGIVSKNCMLQALGILCDNVYRRLKDSSLPTTLIVEIPESGNITKIKMVGIGSKQYSPDKIYLGSFELINDKGATRASTTVTKSSTKGIAHEDFVGKYVLDKERVLTPQERLLVPVLPNYHIVHDATLSICKHIKLSFNTNSPFKTILLRGEAGTGKSQACSAIAAAIDRPFTFFTCSANTEYADFIGQVMPKSSSNLSEESSELLTKVTELGEINEKNIAKAMDLPSYEEMMFAPEDAYFKMTGKKNLEDGSVPSDIEVVQKYVSIIQEKTLELSNSSKDVAFEYVDTDFIKAIQNGWVVEIQEPNVIMTQGTLVGLNGLLQEGRITLPDGRVIERHPESIIIFTTNVSYEGCRNMNQSLIDRVDMIVPIDLPEVDIMTERVMLKTGCLDRDMVKDMVNIVFNINKLLEEEQLTEGTCGMRSLEKWVSSTMITGNPYESALTTVISKAALNSDTYDQVIPLLDESKFGEKRRRKR